MSNGPFNINVNTLGNIHPVSKVVFSFGSNQGDSPVILTRAIEVLAETPNLIVVGISPVYQTPLQGGGPEQDDRLNLVVLAESTLEPMTLLDRAFAIEESFGRERTIPNGPHTLDIDIIMVGKCTSEKDVELPHPRAHERAFMLVPWLGIDPTGEIAEAGPIVELIKYVDRTGVIRRDDIVIANPGWHRPENRN